MGVKKVLVFGGGGRVGQQLVAELLRAGHDVAAVDVLPELFMRQRMLRILNESFLSADTRTGRVSVYGDVDVLDRALVARILDSEAPDLVVNYAIPITWDATKRLANYARVSAAGLGAFTPIQVLAPKMLAQVIADSGAEMRFMVGNLPDITVPVLAGIGAGGGLKVPDAGAGNVGLIQIAIRRQVATELQLPFEDVEALLVAHHVHWVAPREPGYSNSGPFMLRVTSAGEDLTASLGDTRALMNRAIECNYESDASFSATTGILAAQVASALLDDSDVVYRLHTPAPLGNAGGYPVMVRRGVISLDLPADWDFDDAQSAMKICHTLDGVAAIEEDGSVHFTDTARDILSKELDFTLPAVMGPHDIEQVAREQIASLQRLFR